MAEQLESRRLLSATGTFSIVATPTVPADGTGTWTAYFQDSLNDNAGLASFSIDVVGSNGLTVTGSQNDAAAFISGGVSRQTGTKNGKAVYNTFSAGFGTLNSNGTNGINIESSQNLVYGAPGANNAILDSLVYQGVGQETSAANATASADYAASGLSQVPVWGLPADIASGTYSGGTGTLTVSVHPSFSVQYLIGTGAGTWTGPANIASFSSVPPASVAVTGLNLAFTTQPTSATEGTVLPPFAVSIKDLSNNVVTSDNSAITLTLSSGTFSNGSNSATVNAVNGVATFAGLIINTSGDYTVTASDSTDNLSGFVSNSFSIIGTPAAKLDFTTQPADAAVGATLGNVVVVIADSNSMIKSFDNSAVTLTLSSGTFSTGSNSVTVNAVNGVATFSGLVINTAGNYTLTASDTADSLSGFTSNSFHISAAGVTAAKLAFATVPGVVDSGGNFTVTVDVEDSGGNIVSSDTSAVTLAIGTGPSGAALGGTVTVNAVAGVATFSNLTLATLGSTTLTASDGALTGATSSAIFVNGIKITVYRLYSPITKEHLYTTDANEYAVLATRNWNQEGGIYNYLNGPVELTGGGTVVDEPFYRLYNPAILQHLWTVDANEYAVLATRGWSQEGIVGYVVSAANAGSVAGTAALYRLSYPSPALHLWTTDQNEYNTLKSATYGWSDEGVIAYVLT